MNYDVNNLEVLVRKGYGMTRLSWSNQRNRTFEVGLDRGVLYRKNASAVAWNGLSSVEESGGEASAAYYIDGRPFLHLPKPKEYSASLKAFTYPEEFSSIMGVVEATDGMYLDSQMGDAFDLSYRTFVGNAIDGVQANYKIHLIYNATVAPTAVSYATMSNSINPVEFAWDIQAVPVAVEGYRATAHITIDTRHMDAAKLEQIETMLYGDSYSEPRMPDPLTIFDTLTYGDAIIIIDNGDGVFQIDNVNAVDHGDGTFTVSSTPGP
jgi:hypothetical protein